MVKHHTKGKMGRDGVMRYYVPSQHTWLSMQEIEAQRKAEELGDKIHNTVAVVVIVGAFIAMLIIAQAYS
jgi:hypothetical protein